MIRRLAGYHFAPVVALAALLVVAPGPDDSAAAKRKGRSPVWIVFFSSADCPKCARVKTLIRGLRRMYPVRVKAFNIDRPKAYKLFTAIESIHSNGEFAVPLVMVGERLLMGEDRITAELEKTVAKLARSGGSPAPYLGPRGRKAPRERKALRARKAPRVKTRTKSRCECEGRPPTIGEEWSKVVNFIDSLF